MAPDSIAPKGGGVSPRVVETVHLGVRVPAQLVKELDELAKSRERSLSAEVRLAIREYLKSEKAAA